MGVDGLETRGDLDRFFADRLDRHPLAAKGRELTGRTVDLESRVAALEADVAALEADRTVRGIVNANGTINEGTGFTVTKNGTGDYTINFSTAFADIPAFVCSSGRYSTALIAAVAANLSAPTASAVRLNTFNSALNQADSDFHFIARGPA